MLLLASVSERLNCVRPVDRGGQEEYRQASGPGGQAAAEDEVLQKTG